MSNCFNKWRQHTERHGCQQPEASESARAHTHTRTHTHTHTHTLGQPAAEASESTHTHTERRPPAARPWDPWALRGHFCSVSYSSQLAPELLKAINSSSSVYMIKNMVYVSKLHRLALGSLTNDFWKNYFFKNDFAYVSYFYSLSLQNLKAESLFISITCLLYLDNNLHFVRTRTE